MFILAQMATSKAALRGLAKCEVLEHHAALCETLTARTAAENQCNIAAVSAAVWFSISPAFKYRNIVS